MILLMIIGYILIHSLLGGTLFSHSHWDSYTLQSLAWLRGETGLGQDYSYLELAIYNNNWYVSFPPLPSVFMLPFAIVFGEMTPNNLIIAIYSLISAAIAYKCMRTTGVRDIYAAFWAVFVVCGCNLMWMSTNGGVWFQAQSLNMLLCLATVHSMLKNRRSLSYITLALAVGCRPFSLVFFPVLFIYYFMKDKTTQPNKKPLRLMLGQLKCLIGPAIIGAAYMIYNYIRFGNPLELGHNYLPEFVNSPDGQFNLSYLLPNLYNLFIRPISLGSNGALVYPIFDGFMFYIANPIFIIWFICLIKDVLKKEMTAVKATICIAVLANIVLLCIHKTLGGWQFGARYTIDMIPMVFLYLLLSKKARPSHVEFMIGAFAVMLNIYGALAMAFLH
jgi:Gpi18-like mannosyltransferase